MRLIIALSVACIAPIVDAQSVVSQTQLARATMERAAASYDRDGLLVAVDAFERALTQNRSYAPAWVGLARTQVLLENFARAEEALQAAVDLRHDPVELDLLRAQIATLAGDLATASERYAAVLQRRPYHQEARVAQTVLLLGNGTTATVLRRLRGLTRQYPANQQLLTAIVVTAQRRGDRAARDEALQTLLTVHNGSASAQLLAAEVALADGRFEPAEFHAANAVRLAPSHAPAWDLRARAAEAVGTPATALEAYNQLIRIDPLNHRAWYARGLRAAELGDLELADQSWQRAVRAQPDYELARFALERMVLSAYDLGSRRRTELAATYLTSGRALQAELLDRQAERHFRRGLQLDPFSPALRRALAELYRLDDLPARYLNELELLIELETADPEVAAIAEGQRANLVDSVAVRWGIDQFSLARPRQRVLIVHRQDGATVEPAASAVFADYVRSLLQTSNDLELLPAQQHPDDAVGVRVAAREADADLVLEVTLAHREREARLGYAVYRPPWRTPLLARSDAATGNDRLDRLARSVTAAIASIVDPEAFVVARRGDLIVASFGRADGLQVQDTVELVSSDRQVLGNGTVVATDDLLVEVSYRPSGTDRLQIGDWARTAVSIDDDAVDETQPPTPKDAVPPDPAAGLDLVLRIFRSR